MPIEKLLRYLDEQGVDYATINHSPAYTAQKTAAAAHVPGKEVAKTVIVKLDGRMAMAVLPASHQIDFAQLESETGAEHIELATEEEFSALFPNCRVGAMPPFGNLYGMEVFVARKLAEDDDIAFCAGSHTELIRLAYADFERLVEPKILGFATVD